MRRLRCLAILLLFAPFGYGQKCVTKEDEFDTNCKGVKETADAPFKNCGEFLRFGDNILARVMAGPLRGYEGDNLEAFDFFGYEGDNLNRFVDECLKNTSKENLKCKSICLAFFSRCLLEASMKAKGKDAPEKFYKFFCNDIEKKSPLYPPEPNERGYRVVEACHNYQACSKLAAHKVREFTPKALLDFLAENCAVVDCASMATFGFHSICTDQDCASCSKYVDEVGDVATLGLGETCNSALKNCMILSKCADKINCLLKDGLRSQLCCKETGCSKDGGCGGENLCKADWCNRIDCLARNHNVTGYVGCLWPSGCNLKSPLGGCGSGNKETDCFPDEEKERSCNELLCYGMSAADELVKPLPKPTWNGTLVRCPKGAGCSTSKALGGCGEGEEDASTCMEAKCNSILCHDRDGQTVICPRGGGCFTEPPQGGCGDGGPDTCHEDHCNKYSRVFACYTNAGERKRCKETQMGCCSREPGNLGCRSPHECYKDETKWRNFCFETDCNKPTTASAATAQCPPCPDEEDEAEPYKAGEDAGLSQLDDPASSSAKTATDAPANSTTLSALSTAPPATTTTAPTTADTTTIPPTTSTAPTTTSTTPTTTSTTTTTTTSTTPSTTNPAKATTSAAKATEKTKAATVKAASTAKSGGDFAVDDIYDNGGRVSGLHLALFFVSLLLFA